MAAKRRSFRSGASRGAHIRALQAALEVLIEDLPSGPSVRRIALRDHLFALRRAYPELQATATDVAQQQAEDDGDEIETLV